MGKIKIVLAVLLPFLLAGSILAAPARFQVGLAFNPFLPQGEFDDIIGKTAWGGTFSFAYRPSAGIPLSIGTSIGFGIYNIDTWQTWLGLTAPDILVDIQTTNAILVWNIFLRLQPDRGLIRPYLDLFAGLHILTTDTRIRDDDSDNEGNGDISVNNSSDSAFAAGIGAGVMVPIIRFVRRDGQIAAAMDFDLGVRYAKGGRADYLVETEEWGVYDSRSSRTDLLTLTAGLTFVF